MKNIEPVMLVDDNGIDNFVTHKILESCGITNILEFLSPTRALDYLRIAKEPPKLILLDLSMQIMDGFEFLDEFRTLEISKNPIEIIIISTSIDPRDKVKAKEKNCAGFIEKPLSKEKLLEFI